VALLGAAGHGSKCRVALGIVIFFRQYAGSDGWQEVIEVAHAFVKRRAHEILAPVLAVVQFTAGQRMLHAQWMEGRPVEYATSAKRHIGEQVGVGLDKAEQRAVVKLCNTHLAGRIDGQFRKDRAIGLLGKCQRRGISLGHHGAIRADIVARLDVLQQEFGVGRGQQAPFALGLQTILNHDLAIDFADIRCERALGQKLLPIRCQVKRAVIVQQVLPQIRRPQQKAAGAGSLIKWKKAYRREGGIGPVLKVVECRQEILAAIRRNGIATIGHCKHRIFIGRHHGRRGRHHDGCPGLIVVITVAAGSNGQRQ
jgi:hypothetical protein